MGKETRVTLVESPLSGFSSPLPLAAPPPHLGSENEAGGRESRDRVRAAGSSLADRSRLHGRQERAVAYSTTLGLPYPLRGLAAAPGCLGGELAPERLWQAQAASGGARWAPTWPRMGDSGQQLESHGTPELRP